MISMKSWDHETSLQQNRESNWNLVLIGANLSPASKSKLNCTAHVPTCLLSSLKVFLPKICGLVYQGCHSPGNSWDV